MLQRSPSTLCEIEICNNRIGASVLLNRCCSFVPDLESIFRDQMPKILLQHNLPQADLRTAAINPRYSITSSARASSDGGTSRPSAFAVLRLMTSRKRYQYRKEPPCAGGSRSRIRRFRRKAKARELLASLPLPRPQDVRRPAIATPSRVGPRKGA